MLIVLEGVDGAGKSTLADRLIHALGDEHLRLHQGPLKGDPLKEYEWELGRMYSPSSGIHIVADRWHVGELVYGPLYRGVSKLTPAMTRHVELYLDKLGAYKVVVSENIHVINKRLKSRGEDFLQDHHVGLVWDFYNEWAESEGWATTTSDAVTQNILRPALRKQTEAEDLEVFKSYVGSAHPKHLILTDADETTGYGRPFFNAAMVPYPDTSGHFLLTALEEAKVRDYGIACATAEDVPFLWHTLGRPNVVALGSIAAKIARAIPHHTISHPREFMRNSRATTRRRYGLDIKEMLRA